jgi:hypothetical protein
MAIEFRRSAVDIAVRSGIPKARNTGININAAPTPAIVRMVVKRNTSREAIIKIVMNLLNTLLLTEKNTPSLSRWDIPTLLW